MAFFGRSGPVRFCLRHGPAIESWVSGSNGTVNRLKLSSFLDSSDDEGHFTEHGVRRSSGTLRVAGVRAVRTHFPISRFFYPE